ncbi:axonemal dynein light chain domain-containing protein 1-like isoform X2 [Acropora muricata]|uniref:axonemal dynein light chain domain-containing protein 1-like isoform X2 n=1 Tax=Acropora muricata TaxID=159855 RepID=UPI0034E384F6
MSVSTAIKPNESTQISSGETSRASRGLNKLVKTSSSSCVLPILERGKTQMEVVDPDDRGDILDRDKTFLTGMNDFIPDDILNSLTQRPVPPSREQLGPPSKHKKLKPLEVTPPAHRRPANVWNFPNGREKLKHLADQPPCLCGAGRDISFLYDAGSSGRKGLDSAGKPLITPGSEKSQGLVGSKQLETLMKSKHDDNQEATEIQSQIPHSILPSEYHIVKNPGVMGLEFQEDKFTTYIKGHEDHLTVFPSMKPTGRQEVLKLKHAMDSLLARAGVDDEGKELSGPTQIHNLLELVRKEQNIYNVVFNEIIRQVTVECTERGELLANLRKRYADLLDRIPRQVKSLHQEVIAQRALDRRLTEELVRFKASISSLTSELNSVKAHDREVTQQAKHAQEELQGALQESEKNASLISEYHELYELQRRRLEGLVDKLTEERDLWSSAAYTLSLKVTDKHSLNTAKKLHLCEKAWAKLSRHFAIFLSDKDSIQLEKLTNHVQTWRELSEKLNKRVDATEEGMRKKLERLVSQLQRWRKEFQKIVNYDDGSVRPPDQQFIKRLYEDFKSWEGALNEEAELFTGETLLAREEELHLMNKEVDCWTDVAVKIFSRHQSEDGSRWPQHEVMLQFNTEVDRLHQQYHLRIIGENGVAKGIIDLVNPIETWCNKLNAVLNGGEMLLDSDWIRLSNLLREDWIDHLTVSLALIGSTQKDSARLSGEANNPVNVEEVFKKTVKWLSATTNGIDNEDAKIVGRVSRLHSAMIRWMITVLLRLTPDMEDKELEEINEQAKDEEVDASLGGGEILLQAVPEEICNRAQQLFAQLREFSFVLTNCCSDLVIDLMQERRDQGDEHADMDFKDLKRLAVECDGWIRTACLLVQDVMGEGFVFEDLSAGVKKKGSQEGVPSEAKTTTVEAPEKIEQIEGSAVEDAEEVGDKPQNRLPVTGDSTPVNETAKEASKGASIKEPEGDHEVEGENQQTEESRMHVLGHDDNVKTKTLEELPEDQEVEFLTVLETDGQQAAVRSPSPDTRKALEALAAVERLQVQLLETEERAQAAEERAIQAEAELKQALERIRALERSASRASASTGDGSQTPTDKAASTSTVKRPNTQGSSAQQPPRSTSQQSSRPSTRASSRKK